jgi:phosphatidylinositol-3-phosphatase
LPALPYRLGARLALLVAVVTVGAATGSPAEGVHLATSGDVSVRSPVLPYYQHVLVAVFENKSRRDVVGHAPAFRRLANHGADLQRSYAVTHPSQPNYLALFSGRTRVPDDSCPHRWSAQNLASQLIARGVSFAAYSEDLPGAGARACTSPNGLYARKHAPWTNFTTVPRRLSLPYTSFPTSYKSLPAVSFVIPNLCHDTHDCRIRVGNTWLRDHLLPYAAWARRHDSLLIVTFDEDDGSTSNHIYTVLAGAHIRPGHYPQPITHYSVLRTLEAIYSLRALGHAADAHRIRGIWR